MSRCYPARHQQECAGEVWQRQLSVRLPGKRSRATVLKCPGPGSLQEFPAPVSLSS